MFGYHGRANKRSLTKNAINLTWLIAFLFAQKSPLTVKLGLVILLIERSIKFLGYGMTDEQRERREAILEAARAEFAEKGFRGATIKSIAARAKIQSPALIYWYFPNKDALLEAVMQGQLPLLQQMQSLDGLFDQQPRQLLGMLAKGYLQAGDNPHTVQMMRVLLGEMLLGRNPTELLNQQIVPQIKQFLERYLVHQIQLGRMRQHDTRASTRAFLGMLMPQMLSKVILPSLQADGLTDDEHIATVIDIFLNGLKPEE